RSLEATRRPFDTERPSDSSFSDHLARHEVRASADRRADREAGLSQRHEDAEPTPDRAEPSVRATDDRPKDTRQSDDGASEASTRDDDTAAAQPHAPNESSPTEHTTDAATIAIDAEAPADVRAHVIAPDG